MGNMNAEYGSELHLLRWMGRHRRAFHQCVLDAVGTAGRIDWLDFGFASGGGDKELLGLKFLPPGWYAHIEPAWSAFWPQARGIMNWDAVGWLRTPGGPDEVILVEAKAHVAEVRSSCGAKPQGGLQLITDSLKAVKSDLGVNKNRDWLTGYYQQANRIAVLWFLTQHHVPARLVNIYFTGDKPGRSRKCPTNEAAWRSMALNAMDAHLGLPSGHALAGQIHNLFLGVDG